MDIQSMCDKFKNGDTWLSFMDGQMDRRKTRIEKLIQRWKDTAEHNREALTNTMKKINMTLIGLMITRDSSDDEKFSATVQKQIDDLEKVKAATQKQLDDLEVKDIRARLMEQTLNMMEHECHRDEDTPMLAPWAGGSEESGPVDVLTALRNIFDDGSEAGQHLGEVLGQLIDAFQKRDEEEQEDVTDEEEDPI